MIEPWDVLASEAKGSYRVFEVREDRRRSPRTGREHQFYVIDSEDWVNIIPLTPEGQIVFVRQYRHGTDEVTLEVPGGIVDPGETPAEAGLREMLEETGYASDRAIALGAVAPNPAIQSNRCHTFLAPDARKVGEPVMEGAEDLEVVLVNPAEVPGLVADGTITHALVVVAFYLYDLVGTSER